MSGALGHALPRRALFTLVQLLEQPSRRHNERGRGKRHRHERGYEDRIAARTPRSSQRRKILEKDDGDENAKNNEPDGSWHARSVFVRFGRAHPGHP